MGMPVDPTMVFDILLAAVSATAEAIVFGRAFVYVAGILIVTALGGSLWPARVFDLFGAASLGLAALLPLLYRIALAEHLASVALPELPPEGFTPTLEDT